MDTVPAIASGWVIYFHIGALSVLIWDVLNHLRSDYNHLVSDFCVKTFLYLLSRVMTFLYAFTKVVYLTIPMQICGLLDDALSAFYVVGIFSILALGTIHLVLLLENKRPVNLTLFAICACVVCGSFVVPIGVRGSNPLPTVSRVCQDSAHEYVSTTFILLFAYHAVMLSILLLAERENAAEDRENLTTQERYNRKGRRDALFFLTKIPTMEHHVFYVLTTALGLGATVWFLASSRQSGSFRLIPVTVYLVCSSITLGRVLRANKREEQQRRVKEALSAPIKLDMPRLDINDTLASQTTTRTMVPAENYGTQCDVAGIFQSDAASCPPPIVEIEVNKVIQSKHDYSTAESDYQSDDGRWGSKLSLGK